MTADIFDYVIIGGGSAGSVLARRLVDDGASVCLLEAGPTDSHPYIHIPAGFVKTLFDARYTWPLQTEPTVWTAGRAVMTPQGRVLGGSSSVNGMVFIRGQAADYDGWSQRGNRGWGYADVLPYFRKLEQRIGTADDAYRGRSGPLPVTDSDWRHPLCDAFLAAAARCGLPTNADYNGPRQEGASYYQRAIRGRRRVSAARAFLHPVLRHAALSVRTNAFVTGIDLDGRRAVGATYRVGGPEGDRRAVRALREVIVCAGALNTPKLLQLSGIGHGEFLRHLGIGVLHDLPGVGENLRDHYSPRLVARARGVGSINTLVRGVPLAREVVKWMAGRPSVLAVSAALAAAFGKSDPALDHPDFTVTFTPASFRAGLIGVLDSFPGMTCGAWQMRPESVGHVRIRSNDPAEPPRIQPNYLSAETDRRILLHALRTARRILTAPELSILIEREELPGSNVMDDDELLDFARRYGASSYHFVGSCRMGPRGDRASVVDDELRVHGIEALRVVDASVMPTIPSANTYATVLMIAEKASDLIRAGNGRRMPEVTAHPDR